MDFIVSDKGGDWHFDGEKTYWCLDKAGKPVGKIYAEYVPDPVQLWESKCVQLEVNRESQAGKLLRPSNVTWKLWEHKNNAEFNN